MGQGQLAEGNTDGVSVYILFTHLLRRRSDRPQGLLVLLPTRRLLVLLAFLWRVFDFSRLTVLLGLFLILPKLLGFLV